MLRAIVSQTVGNLSDGPGVDNSGILGQNGFPPHGEEKKAKKESFDDWDDHQTFLIALEKFESWIFSRIVESVWWQVNPYYFHLSSSFSFVLFNFLFASKSLITKLDIVS